VFNVESCYLQRNKWRQSIQTCCAESRWRF